MEVSQSVENIDSSANKSMEVSMCSEKNCNIDETTVLSVKLDKDECEDDQSFESLKTVISASSSTSSKVEATHSEIVYAMEQSSLNKHTAAKSESRLVASSSLESYTTSFAVSPAEEADSGLESTTTAENTPFASRPESELVLLPEDRPEEEVEPTPRQLEMLLEESGASGDSSPRDTASPEKSSVTTGHFINDLKLQNGDHSLDEQPIINGSIVPVAKPAAQPRPAMTSSDDSRRVDEDTYKVVNATVDIDTSSCDVKEEISKIESKLLLEPTDDDPLSNKENVPNSADENSAKPASAEALSSSSDGDLNARKGGGINDEIFEEMENKPLLRRKRSNDIEETHKSVEEIISEIQDPNLDCSMDDIQAMVDKANLEPEKEKLLPAGDSDSQQQQLRVSPEFTRAADLIDKNPDRLFDPEDPAVKELEEWELKSQHEKSINIEDDESGPKLLGIFKNKNKRHSKIEERPLVEGEREEDKEDDINWGCINSWLIRILIKIFD